MKQRKPWEEGGRDRGGLAGGARGAPTHLPLYDVGRHGHRRAPGDRSMYYQALALDQSTRLI